MAIAIGLIMKDLDALGLGKWNEASVDKRRLKDLAKIRESYQRKEINKREYKMMAKDVLKV